MHETTIKRAEAIELPYLNDLIARSNLQRSHAAESPEPALSGILIDESYLLENLCYTIVRGGQPIAFFSVAEKDGLRYLDHVWAAPQQFHQGLELMACEFIFTLAQKKGWPQLRALVPPGNEKLFSRMGFYDTGLRTPTGALDGRILPVFERRFLYFKSGRDGEIVTGLSHLTISVDDISSNYIFYVETLGLTPIALRQGQSAYLLAGDTWIVLAESDARSREESKALFDHIAFLAPIESFSRILMKVRAQGLEVRHENSEWGASLYFNDPAANNLEVHEGTWRERIDHLRRDSSEGVQILI